MRDFKEHLILSGTPLKNALQQLDLLASDAIIFVVNNENQLLGSLTDGDVRRGLLKGVGLENSVNDIIQPNPKFIRKGEQDIQKIIQ